MMRKYFYYILASILLINQMIIEPAYGNARDTVTGSFNEPGEATPNVPGQEQSPFQKYFDSPMGIIIVSGIAAVYSGILLKAAGEQEKESKENIKKIEKMIASFKDSYAGFCPNGREDLKDAKCYCYTDAGKQNTNRSNSQICKDLWAKDTYKLGAGATDYGIAAYNPDVAGCVTVTGQFDETCKCKKYLDSAGKNACKKETTVSMPTEAFTTGYASGSGISDLLKYSANATNGNPRFDLINAGALSAKAINSRKMADDILGKLPLKANEKPPVIDENNALKFARAVLGDKNLGRALSSSGGMAMNVASSRTDNPAVDSLLKQAQAKVGIDVTGSGKGLENKKDKKKGATFNFSDDAGGNSGGQVLGAFPEEKNYKYKNSDIVTDNSASIFEIISNRYVQSGLRRLFDDGSTSEPIKAP